MNKKMVTLTTLSRKSNQLNTYTVEFTTDKINDDYLANYVWEQGERLIRYEIVQEHKVMKFDNDEIVEGKGACEWYLNENAVTGEECECCGLVKVDISSIESFAKKGTFIGVNMECSTCMEEMNAYY
ncbi:hypothetical protein D1872_195470 [compost metagenome]